MDSNENLFQMLEKRVIKSNQTNERKRERAKISIFHIYVVVNQLKSEEIIIIKGNIVHFNCLIESFKIRFDFFFSVSPFITESI